MRRPPSEAVFLIVILFFLLSSSALQAKTPFIEEFGKKQEVIFIDAIRFTYDRATDTYVAEGEVEITRGDQFLSADRATLDMINQVATAEGNVLVSNPEGVLECESIELHLDTETGIILQGDLVVEGDRNYYFVSGTRLEKIGDDRYLVSRGTYTTCECGDGTPSWKVSGRKIDMTFEGYAYVRDALFYWWHIPVLYTPFAVFPVKIERQTGFLMPEISQSSRHGTRVVLPFFWAIADNVDMTIYTDYMTERGIKEGVEYRYAMSKEWMGEANVDFIEDRKEDLTRWEVSYQGRHGIHRHMDIRSNVNLISDNMYPADFEEDINARWDAYLRSNVIAGSRWQRYDVNADFQYFDSLIKEDNSYTLQRYPQLSFAGMTQPIVDPLFFRVNAVGVNFYRPKVSEEEKLLNQLTEQELFMTRGDRLDLVPELVLPLNFRNYFTLTPTAGFRETVYYMQYREEHWEHRLLYLLGSNLTTEFQRVFQLQGKLIRGLKHSIEPGVSYAYQPEPDQDDLPIFDGSDRLTRVNLLTLYLYNRLWAKAFSSRLARDITVRLGDLRLEQDVDLEETLRDMEGDEDERRPFRDLRIRLEAVMVAGFLIDKMLLRGETWYNWYEDRLDRINGLLAFKTINDSALAAEYRYRLDEMGDKSIQSLVGTAILNLFDVVSLQYQTKYNFLEEEFLESVYSVKYMSLQNCWDVTLSLEEKTRPHETVYRLLLNLTGLVTLSGSR